MSTKGQQQDLVEDSWEEIDEDRLTDRLSKLSNRDSTSLPSGSDEGSQSASAGGSNSTLTAMLEEELRPRMILQRPQMQILRRPQSSQAQEEKAAAEGKPKTQVKSLDQRKQAYAEARLRILGSAHDEEEQQQKQVEQPPKKGSPNTNGYRINNNNATTNINSGNIRLERPPYSIRPPPGTFHMQQHPSQHPGPGPFYPPHPSGGRNHPPPEATAAIHHHYYQQQQQQIGGPHVPGGYHFQHHQHHPQHPHQKQMSSPWSGMAPQSTGYHHDGLGGPMAAFGGPLGHSSSNNNVLRMPAGPDGSHGFTIRR